MLLSFEGRGDEVLSSESRKQILLVALLNYKFRNIIVGICTADR